MKTQALIILLFVLCACTVTTDSASDISYLSWAELRSNPSLFEGRNIEVCGWFKTGQELCSLSPAQNDSGASIWVTPESDICLPLVVFNNPVQQWAIVKGDFYADGGFGHLGEYEFTLHKAQIEFIDQGCENP